MFNRLLAALTLCFGVIAFPTDALAYACDDGISRALSADLCPGRLFNNDATNVTTTGFTSAGETDVQGIGATRYIYVSTSPYPPGCSSAWYTHPADTTEKLLAKAKCTRHDLMRSGSGASAHTSETLVYAGSYAKAITGLAQNTQYYIHESAQGGACDDFPNYTQNCRRPGALSLVTTTPVLTLTDDTPDPPVEALTGAQRFIKNGGSDLADGLTDSTAWASLSKCSLLPTGTDCNLKSGSTFVNQTLTADWPGTANDYATIRTYEMSAGSPIATPVGGTRAIIKGGSLNTTCLTAGNCDYRMSALSAAGLSGEYDSYLYVDHKADYLKVSMLEIREVHTLGLIAQGNWPTQGSLHHVVVEDNLFENIGLTVVLFENGMQDLIFRRNTLSLYGTCSMQRQMGGTNYSELCPTAIFPAGGAIARSYPARALIEDNFFGPGAGEGFDCHSGSTYVIMRGNTLVRLQSGALYPDGCNHVVIEGNISIGPRGEDFGYYNGPGTGFGGGFASVVEDWQGAGAPNQINVTIRNNLSIATEYSTSWGMFSQQVARGKQVGGYDVGNTHIDSITYALYIEPSMTNTNVPALRYSNNLNWDQSNGAAGCVAPNLSNITNTHNHKYVSWSDSDCNDATDTSGDPLLAVSNYATWAAYNIGNLPTFANAKPQAGSPANNAGTPLTTTVIDYTAYGYAATQMADVLSGAITLENWAKILYYDALDQARSATTPDIGCCEGP